jgi:hypothetical protein
MIQAQETLKAKERRARTRLLNARSSAMVITSTEIGTVCVNIEGAVRRRGLTYIFEDIVPIPGSGNSNKISSVHAEDSCEEGEWKLERC